MPKWGFVQVDNQKVQTQTTVKPSESIAQTKAIDPTPDKSATSPRCRRSWEDVPIRSKVTLLIAIGTTWGAVLGIAAGHFSSLASWQALVGVMVLILILTGLAKRWISQPLEQLIDQAQRLYRSPDSPSIKAIPTHRQDEIGQLGCAIKQLGQISRRDYYEARQLRRTLDHRVEKATHKATKQMTQLAMRDSLTGLGNRRFLDAQFEPLIRSCQKSHVELICIMMDMDNFKPVNDTLGHQTGDELLKFVGSLLQSQIRDTDCAIRLGGDEFVILMPNSTVDRAQQMVSYMRNLIKSHTRTTLPDTIHLNISSGIASLIQDNAHNSQSLLQLADQRLYEAKRNGKGVTIVGDE